jgi:hypothetical protein
MGRVRGRTQRRSLPAGVRRPGMSSLRLARTAPTAALPNANAAHAPNHQTLPLRTSTLAPGLLVCIMPATRMQLSPSRGSSPASLKKRCDEERGLARNGRMNAYEVVWQRCGLVTVMGGWQMDVRTRMRDPAPRLCEESVPSGRRRDEWRLRLFRLPQPRHACTARVERVCFGNRAVLDWRFTVCMGADSSAV